MPLCLENTPESPLTDLDQKLFAPGGYRLCLDAGHLMGYHQETLLDLPILQSTSIIHWSAPCGGDRHHPLTELTQTERETAREILRRTSEECTQLIEVFSWQGIEASLPVLRALWEDVHGTAV